MRSTFWNSRAFCSTSRRASEIFEHVQVRLAEGMLVGGGQRRRADHTLIVNQWRGHVGPYVQRVQRKRAVGKNCCPQAIVLIFRDHRQAQVGCWYHDRPAGADRLKRIIPVYRQVGRPHPQGAAAGRARISCRRPLSRSMMCSQACMPAGTALCSRQPKSGHAVPRYSRLSTGRCGDLYKPYN